MVLLFRNIIERKATPCSSELDFENIETNQKKIQWMIQLFTLRRAHQVTGSAALTYENIWWVAWWIIVRIRLHSTLHHSADPASAAFFLH